MRRALRVLLALSVAVALAALLPGVANAAAGVPPPGRFGPGFMDGDNTSYASNDRPLTFDGKRFETDQRTMAFNEQRVAGTVPIDGRYSSSGNRCGDLSLLVFRYQEYRLDWHSSPRVGRDVLRRGSLIRDAGRPYVGAFLLTSGDLVIQTYDRVNGKVVNPWVADRYRTSSATRAVVLSQRGLLFVGDGGRTVTSEIILPSGCI